MRSLPVAVAIAVLFVALPSLASEPGQPTDRTAFAFPRGCVHAGVSTGDEAQTKRTNAAHQVPPFTPRETPPPSRPDSPLPPGAVVAHPPPSGWGCVQDRGRPNCRFVRGRVRTEDALWTGIIPRDGGRVLAVDPRAWPIDDRPNQPPDQERIIEGEFILCGADSKRLEESDPVCVMMVLSLDWVVLSGEASPIAIVKRPQVPQESKTPRFVHLGEGFSSTKPGEPMPVSFRAWDLYSLPAACEGKERAVRFEAPKLELHCPVGSWFDISQFAVVARDSSGNIVPDVPLVVEIEEFDQHVILDYNANMEELPWILPVAETRVRLVFEAICPESREPKVTTELVFDRPETTPKHP